MDLPREAINPREYFLTNFSRLDRDGMADVAAHAFDLLDTHDKAAVLAATVLLVPPATEPARARKINCIARMLERMKDDDVDLMYRLAQKAV